MRRIRLLKSGAGKRRAKVPAFCDVLMTIRIEFAHACPGRYLDSAGAPRQKMNTFSSRRMMGGTFVRSAAAQWAGDGGNGRRTRQGFAGGRVARLQSGCVPQ